MDKGSRVKIVRGRKAVGVTGTVFWLGDNKWGEGKRAGIDGDDGEKYWIDAAHLETTDEEAPEIEPPEKGTRVRFSGEDGEVEGVIIWVGEAKSGNGYRVGVKDDEGEAHWMDARKVSPVDAAGDAEWDDGDPAF